MRLALCLILLVTLPACDAISDAADNAACQATGYADSGTVRASVAGDSFSGTCIRVDTEGGTLTIAGADNVVSQNNQEVITLAFPSTEIRSYALGTDAATAVFVARTEDPEDQAEETYAAISGTLRLDAVSETTARGSFSFTGRTVGGTEVTVSGGSFNVTF